MERLPGELRDAVVRSLSFPTQLREEALPLQSAPEPNARVLGCAAGSSVP